jgi:hypothetical protein
MTLPARGQRPELTFQRLAQLDKRHFQTFSTLGRTKKRRLVSFHVLGG